ncbi:efflux RND transporter periplasmic adaptor subunit [Candidatus Kryptonium thompsonii]|uniref:efflux RND transporter periplasmic adaptor subunit n=1 Tax=Candidatus Kryptonium thompsonii TaxID=1633631 RepID=UPI00070732A6|nr:efflux RND transporter periplasmic adaptor subunit [Candidatus Kryptonium thompsoni]CUS94387.1 membrane fusion protein, Cu(I)/Ag(I) efflux system [Candidatus Kryptonium thompsoni]
MNKKYILIVIAVAIISVFVGYSLSRLFNSSHVENPKSEIKSERKILYYKDPMHPWITSDKPGKAPDCGMDLVPVYEGEEESEPGIIRIDLAIVQNIGVKIEPVKRMRLTKTIRTVGRVDYNETKITVLTTKISGWIEKLYVDYTGKFVRKGEPLFEVYSPELVTAQEEYLRAISYRESVSGSKDSYIIEGANLLVESARKRLLYWDISEEQIKELENTKQVRKTLVFYSPVDGVVVEKNVFLGTKVAQGMTLMRIADLSTVWIYADVYEYELPWVKVGEEAEVELSYIPGKVLKGKVVYVYPFLQPETRTVKVRLEFENPGYLLKPDMYVNVNIKSKVAIDALVVPEQSVIRTGKRDIVVAALGGGRFKSIDVKLGVLADGYYQVLEGLHENQNIVTSSHFLIDSESNLKAALAGLTHQHGSMLPEEKEKEKAKEMVDSGKHKHEEAKSEVAGEKSKKPEKMKEHKHEERKELKRESHEEHKEEKKSEAVSKVIDPVCGMEIEPDEELSYVYNGKKYYFCMKSDMEKFKKDPEKYLKRK